MMMLSPAMISAFDIELALWLGCVQLGFGSAACVRTNYILGQSTESMGNLAACCVCMRVPYLGRHGTWYLLDNGWCNW